MVTFRDEETRDLVLESGVVHFDKKPVILRPWTTDIESLKSIKSVPIWIRLPDLGLQYWGTNCLSALVSTIGKPIMIDKITKYRSMIKFAQILVDMEISDSLPKSISYINERGHIMDQMVDYEWLPTRCSSCKKLGHTASACKFMESLVWRKKEAPAESTANIITQETSSSPSKQGKNSLSQISIVKESKSQSEVSAKEHEWTTPKKPGTIKPKTTADVQSSKNAFSVLQEQKQFLNDPSILLNLNGQFQHNELECIRALLETKIKGARVQEVLNSNFKGWDFYSSMSLEGRVLLIWKPNWVKIDVLIDNAQFIHCKVQIWTTCQTFFLYVVYGSNQLEIRKDLWSELSAISLPVKSWIILGDFNSVFEAADRMGGKTISPKEVEDSRRWLDLGQVEEMKLLGSYYTWSNNQDGTNHIFSKLDRVFVNEDWLDTFPNVNAIASWEVISDHCAIILKHIAVQRSGVYPFRFFNMWTQHPLFKSTVQASWMDSLASEGYGLQQIMRKLHCLKFILKRSNWRIVGNIIKNYEDSKLLFQQAKNNLFSNPNDQNLRDVERATHREFKIQEAAYASFLYQKSKVDWIRFGDENSTMFYARRSSAASGFIENSVVQSGVTLNLDDQYVLIKPFTYQEVKSAMFSIKAVKSPGPDGFGAGFYKSLWPIIGREVAAAVIEFFDKGHIPKALNSTILALIPKVSQPLNASDYRPIACCNTLYKCISKMLCNRLNSILPKLINQNQGAFVKNRSLAHNVLILQDLLKGYNRKHISPRCLMKIDLSKAYDSIDWDFLENLLHAYKFPGRFIKWIMVCLRGSSYCILINGQLHGNFKGGKGLRQGDPISPLLFVLVMEYLTRALHEATKRKDFRFHPLCKSLNITNLCFADDLLLVCKAHDKSIQILHQIFRTFSIASGLNINQGKSRIYFGGISAAEKEKLLSLTSMTEGQFPLMYLGIPLRPTKWKAMDCDLIISKIRQRLHSWASHNLSYAGRVQLIQSALLGIRNFWMSIFLLPQKVIREIDSLCRNYLWGGNGFRSKFHLASWDLVCRPKSYGGLGFKEGTLWNKINLARYIWAISSKQDSLWVKWVNCVYLKGGLIWDYELQHDTSWYWKKLVKMSKSLNEAILDTAVSKGKIKLGTLYLHFSSGFPFSGMKTVWCSLSQPKHRFILWLAAHQKLLTRDHLIHCHIPVSSHCCPICEAALESHDHLFFDCWFSRKLHHSISSWLGALVWPESYQDWCCWLSVPRKDCLSRVVLAALAATVYFIWINRNRCWLESSCFAVDYVTGLIRDSVKVRVHNFSHKCKKLNLREKMILQLFL
ncbi:uncharacterized protein LOC133825827 [Humulus lupulus]|uniref:uncharacterized protein LOC133825827 n=1 Tax=Humulus lupulus TaxID=3486 RepID=UPI002B40D438|nr:uncharacterized protein LOC133825827 [Humulus lupulus]